MLSSDQLQTILLSIIHHAPQTRAEFDRARRLVCGDIGVNQPPNRELLQAYQKLVDDGKLERDERILSFLRKANIRNLSGIAVVTSLIKPYMCPGKCIYCPTEVRMPKSYIASEPAAARALRLDFSPYEQMRKRIEMLQKNGHHCDKIEYIIKGGTWNAYPLKYQYWFMLESFRAANDLSRCHSEGATATEESLSITNKRDPSPLAQDDSGECSLEQLQELLEKEQHYNETANHRIIGVTLETRPDVITPKTMHHMRAQGCTRIELGLQAPDDKILELVQRGHTVDQFRHAMKLLRDVGFKVDLHFMPDLPGTTPAHDVKMYKLLFSDLALRPDMVKIYPCTVIKSAELYQWLEDGRYTPYGDEALFEALLEMKKATPRYCRISRLIRDIPSDKIEAGNKITNLREALEAELHKRGGKCECLRCREVGRVKSANADHAVLGEPQLFVDQYETVGGTEYFLSYEDAKRKAVFGFLRLRVPTTLPPTPSLTEGGGDVELPPLAKGRAGVGLNDFFPELQGAAFIRELHVYGTLVGIGKQSDKASQHKGLGKQLVAKAEEIAKEQGYKKIAIISGVGVRDYYRKLGYELEGTYMTKNIS